MVVSAVVEVGVEEEDEDRNWEDKGRGTKEEGGHFETPNWTPSFPEEVVVVEAIEYFPNSPHLLPNSYCMVDHPTAATRGKGK